MITIKADNAVYFIFIFSDHVYENPVIAYSATIALVRVSIL
jgi:hypothetical protein